MRTLVGGLEEPEFNMEEAWREYQLSHQARLTATMSLFCQFLHRPADAAGGLEKFL